MRYETDTESVGLAKHDRAVTAHIDTAIMKQIFSMPLLKTHAGSAFTLIEVLIVVVILGVLLAISAPVVEGTLRASRLTSAGDNVRNFLTEAQQRAVMENTDVQVRLYEGVDGSAGTSVARVRRLEVPVLRPVTGGDGAFEPGGSPLTLDGSLAISALPKLSSLLSRPFRQDVDGGGRVGDRYASFRFFPDGSTDLPLGQPWFLTVLEEKFAEQNSAPANFFTIQVQASTGKVRTYRP